MKRAGINLIKFPSRNALLRVLLARTRSYRKIRYEIQINKFGHLSSGHYIYATRDIRIRG